MLKARDVWKIARELRFSNGHTSCNEEWWEGWNRALMIMQGLLEEAASEGEGFKVASFRDGLTEGGYRVKVREVRTAEVVVDAPSERQALQKAVLMRQEPNADEFFDWHVEDRTWTGMGCVEADRT